MEKQKKNRCEQLKKCNKTSKRQDGITLIALVISIIVMLILAGVSINAIVGENGILTNAQTATFAQKIATYKEELEMNIVGNAEDMLPDREKVTALNDSVRDYIPSIKDEDIGKFGIIAGELYYLGSDAIEKQTAINQNLKTKAEDQSIEDFIASVENDALESIIKNMAGDSFKVTDEEGNQVEVGVALKNKGVGVANWKIITEVENRTTKATYGTDWYYVEEGTEIEGIGKLNSSYIMNYKTGKAVKFDGTKHSMLADGAGIAAGKDYLVCNIDPSAIESSSTDLGDGVEFVNFENLQNAFTPTSFVIDGIDDYIKVQYDSEEDKAKLAENGFTFEFYGIYNKGKSTKLTNGVVSETTSSTHGLFCYWNGIETGVSPMRFAITDSDQFIWNSGFLADPDGITDFPEGPQWTWNIMYPENDDLSEDEEVYITVSLNAKDSNVVNGIECYRQSVYINGKLFCEGNYNKKQWDSFIKNELNNLRYFCLGRCQWNAAGYWHYTKLNSYALRLYSKGLTENEIIANYNATVAYHNILANSGNAGTSGETDGEDIGDINN